MLLALLQGDYLAVVLDPALDLVPRLCRVGKRLRVCVFPAWFDSVCCVCSRWNSASSRIQVAAALALPKQGEGSDLHFRIVIE